MISEDFLKRITISHDICHGKPCIRRMRWPVEVILDMLGSGMSIDEILQEHPELEKDDFIALFQFMKLLSSGSILKDVA